MSTTRIAQTHSARLIAGYCLVLLSAGAAGAQALVAKPTPPSATTVLPAVFSTKVHFDLHQAPLDEMIAEIQKNCKVNTVVDGVPVLTKADIKCDETLKELIDKLANAFDYSWTVSKAGSVLMTKKFSNPDERPQVNLPEMLEMTRNMVSALTLVDYDKDESHWPGLVRQVGQMMTQDQMKALRAGERLQGTDLSPTQKLLLHQAILSNSFVKTLNLWEAAVPVLENMPTSKLQARKHDAATRDAYTPAYDYYYVYRAANGQLHVLDIPHIVFGNVTERIVTP